MVSSKERCLELSREVVAAKIANAAAVLRRYRKNEPEAVPLESFRDLDAFQERAAGGSAASLDELRGTEGAAAARYFAAMAPLVPSGFTFTGCTRRPPRDPLNAAALVRGETYRSFRWPG